MADLGEFEQAVKDFEKAIKSEPNFIDAHIQLANVKNRQGKFDEAEKGYEKALEIDPNYLTSLYYSLAIVEFDQKKYSEAAEHFEAFLAKPRIGEKRKIKAENYLKNAKFAAEAIANPVPFEPINVGSSINTEEDEYLPALTADGEKMIYTAVRQNQEDFFLSKYIDGAWTKGEAIASVNTPDYNEGAQSVSADGRFLVFTMCDRPGGYGRCDLYFTEYVGGKWTQVKNMREPINSKYKETLPSISADGKTLYFASDRPGGIGGLDIYKSERNSEGNWSKPVNLKLPINTPKHEQAPFIHPDGETLYFMSEGHPGMGRYDLYFSRKNKDNSWAEPTNLGYPINTEGNEGAFSVSLDGSTAYFASDVEGGFGRHDIYTFELYEEARPAPVTYVKAKVRDAKSRRPLEANIEFIDLSTGEIHTASMTDASGEFLVTLPTGKDYALNVFKEKYLFHSENFALSGNDGVDEPFLLKIDLSPISESLANLDKSKPIILKNVFFETGSAELKSESLSELNRLKNLLEKNAELKIKINGHTDNVGSDEDNLSLSEARSKAVHDYLIDNGIDAVRLKYQGFGETQPIESNDTEKGRQQNRRTEFILIE